MIKGNKQLYCEITRQGTTKVITRDLYDMSGISYKFDRGVIGINQNGEKIEVIIDNTIKHHSEATCKIGYEFNCKFNDKLDAPFLLGLELSKNDIVIIQLEGKTMIIYLPYSLTKKQYNSLIKEINIRSSFNISFTHKNKDFYSDKIDIEFVRLYLNQILNQLSHYNYFTRIPIGTKKYIIDAFKEKNILNKNNFNSFEIEFYRNNKIDNFKIELNKIPLEKDYKEKLYKKFLSEILKSFSVKQIDEHYYENIKIVYDETIKKFNENNNLNISNRKDDYDLSYEEYIKELEQKIIEIYLLKLEKELLKLKENKAYNKFEEKINNLYTNMCKRVKLLNFNICDLSNYQELVFDFNQEVIQIFDKYNIYLEKFDDYILLIEKSNTRDLLKILLIVKSFIIEFKNDLNYNLAYERFQFLDKIIDDEKYDEDYDYVNPGKKYIRR